MVFEVSESVRLEIGEVDNVIVVLKGVCKRESVKKQGLSFLVLIHITCYVLLIIIVVWLSMVKATNVLQLILGALFSVNS
jgi:hypothetical protein